jgi:isopenicillin N synthase-like dioxygenase
MQSTAELVRAFNDRGFVAVAHPLCPEPELAQLRAEYDALFAAEVHTKSSA